MNVQLFMTLISRYIASILLFTTLAVNAVPKPDALGFRFGLDAESDVNLTISELYLTLGPPWAWELGDTAKVLLLFETAAGVVDGEGSTAFVLSVTPVVRLAFEDVPFDLVVSSGPAYYSDDTFGSLDIGGEFQFISRFGVDWRINENWRIGYRYEHTSNAGLDDTNPGLNFHVLGVACMF